jgi:oxaloacetate decarboxylase gamma subunit
MQVSNLLIEGVNLMLLGMGSVFIFLTVLVLAMNGVSYIAKTLFKDDPREKLASQMILSPSVNEGDDIIAVISAAISRYRAK